MALQQSHNLVYMVGIDGIGAYIGLAYGFGNGIALRPCTRCYDYFGEYLGMLRTLMGHNCAHASAADDNYFCHCFISLLCLFSSILSGTFLIESYGYEGENAESYDKKRVGSEHQIGESTCLGCAETIDA